MSFKTFIQWKGTDVCLDWNCTCGKHNHLDSDFAYFVECSECHKVFELGTEVSLTETIDPKHRERAKLSD